MGIASINPATGETLKTLEALTNAQLEHKLQLARDIQTTVTPHSNSALR
jgi:hypothetical protein